MKYKAGLSVLMTSVLASSAISLPAAAEEASRPLLLELFTSQSCSSCPPADAVLHELAMHPDLLALEFHVDYWNNLGWVDPFSSAEFTSRQQMYSARHGFGVYTPQLVIEGSHDVVGSNRSKIVSTIAEARQDAHAAAASISRKGDAVSLSVGKLAGADESAAANVYLVSFDSHHSTDVRGGENSGRTLTYTNVVVSMRKVGEWRNQPLMLEEHLQSQEHGERLALIAQAADGTVWAVAQTPQL